MEEIDLTYPGGLDELLKRHNSRRDPLDFGDECLPPLDVDLAALTQKIVTEAATKRQPGDPRPPTSWVNKRRHVAESFIGNTHLAYLNGLLIANLRKTGFPAGTDDLFQRLWSEQSDHLIAHLDLRWQVSSIMTFAEHGKTPAQREAGQALRMLFAMMKLYEFERLFSGFEPTKRWPFGKRSKSDLPMEIEPFSLVNGGLDASTLAPVWELAISDPVMAPLAQNLMEKLNEDPGTVFRRLTQMRIIKRIQKAMK